MIKEFLKAAKVKTEKELLSKYPTEEAFFKAFPKLRKKAQYGITQDPWEFLGQKYSRPEQTIQEGNPLAEMSPVSDELDIAPEGETQLMPISEDATAPSANSVSKNVGNQLSQLGKQAGQALHTALTAGIPALASLIKDDRTRTSDKVQEAYNPFKFGTGSQAIWKNGGQIKYKCGGKMKANNGIQVEDGGDIQPLGANPYTGNTMLFQGNSHANGGIDIQYMGVPVEVQGGEPAFVDNDGSLNVFGAMSIPGTNRTFQSVGKQIGKAENKLNKQLAKSKELFNKGNVNNKFSALSINSAAIIQDAADKKLQVLAAEKESLANIQNDILEYAHNNGLNPKQASKKFAKSGIKISYDDGKTWSYNTPKEDIKPLKTNNMIPQIEMLQERPIPNIKNNSIGMEKLHDSLGNYFYSPIFPQDWSRSEIQAGLAQLPNMYDELPLVNNYGDYSELNMEDGGKIKAVSGKKVRRVKRMSDEGEETASIPRDQWYDLRMGIMAAESSNNYNAVPKDPKTGKLLSSAYGAYQFIEGTRKQYYNKYFKDKYKTFDEFDKEFKKSPALQDQVMNVHLQDLAEKFDNDPDYIILAHRLGEGAAKSIKEKGYYTDKKGRKITMDSPIGTSQNPTDNETPRQFIQKVRQPQGNNTNNGGNLEEVTPIESSEVTPVGVNLNTPMWNRDAMFTISGLTAATPAQEAPATQPQAEYQPISSSRTKESLAGRNQLGLADFLGEIPAIFDSPDFVQKQTYEPILYQPYSVSFQDRLNENNASFRSIQQQLVNNPEALSAFAGQKYNADNVVLGEQYRTNQAIQNDVINKNIGLLNQAELTNLQLADQQYIRQSQAKSNTDARRQQALSSISAKIAQNRQDNMNIRLMENLFNYRPDEQGVMQYVGPDANLTPYNPTGQSSITQKIDQFGNTSTTTKTKSTAEQQRDAYRNQLLFQQALKKTSGF